MEGDARRGPWIWRNRLDSPSGGAQRNRVHETSPLLPPPLFSLLPPPLFVLALGSWSWGPRAAPAEETSGGTPIRPPSCRRAPAGPRRFPCSVSLLSVLTVSPRSVRFSHLGLRRSVVSSPIFVLMLALLVYASPTCSYDGRPLVDAEHSEIAGWWASRNRVYRRMEMAADILR